MKNIFFEMSLSHLKDVIKRHLYEIYLRRHRVHIFFEMYVRRLKDDIKKTSFLRRIRDDTE